MEKSSTVTRITEKDVGRDNHYLEPGQVAMIEEALRSVGEYGEIRLIVEKGRLRFLITQKSFDALKWQPGCLVQETE